MSNWPSFTRFAALCSANNARNITPPRQISRRQQLLLHGETCLTRLSSFKQSALAVLTINVVQGGHQGLGVRLGLFKHVKLSVFAGTDIQNTDPHFEVAPAGPEQLSGDRNGFSGEPAAVVASPGDTCLCTAEH